MNINTFSGKTDDLLLSKSLKPGTGKSQYYITENFMSRLALTANPATSIGIRVMAVIATVNLRRGTSQGPSPRSASGGCLCINLLIVKTMVWDVFSALKCDHFSPEIG